MVCSVERNWLFKKEHWKRVESPDSRTVNNDRKNISQSQTVGIGVER